MESILAYALLVMFFFSTFPLIWRRDIVFGGFYVFLFIYCAFAFAGYIYLPELSIAINAYFGPDAITPVIYFTLASFAVYVVLALSFGGFSRARTPIHVSPASVYIPWIAPTIILVHLAIFFGYFAWRYSDLSYASINEPDNIELKDAMYWLWGMCQKWSVPIALVLYCVIKDQEIPKTRRVFATWLFCAEVLLLVAVCAKISNRTDLLSLALGLVFIEIFASRIGAPTSSLKKQLTLVAILAISALGLFVANAGRFGNEDNAGVDLGAGASWLTSLISKDYHPPAHVMIAQFYYELLNPVRVLISNSANALMFLGVPFLQEYVTEYFNPGVTARHASYAYYLLGEGYLLIGFIGFIYSGCVAYIGILLWRLCARSDSLFFNCLIVGLTASQFANFSRSQSAVFVKHFYLFLIPAVLLYLLYVGRVFCLRKKVSCDFGQGEVRRRSAGNPRPPPPVKP
jgi:hypothetical protein